MAGDTNYPTSLDDNTTLDETLEDGAAGDDVLAAHQNNQNAAIKALEAKVGVDSSVVVSTIDYFIRNVLGYNFDGTTLIGGSASWSEIRARKFTSIMGTQETASSSTYDFLFGNYQTLAVELTTNVSSSTISFGTTPTTYVKECILVIIQDGTGNRTLSWPTNILWAGGSAPTLSTGANAIDVFKIYYIGGTVIGEIVGQNFS